MSPNQTLTFWQIPQVRVLRQSFQFILKGDMKQTVVEIFQSGLS